VTNAISMIDDGQDAYRAGACNIGPDEIRKRRAAGVAAAIATVALGAGLIVIGAPAPARLLVALPAAGSAVGFLQARSRFCLAFAIAGVRNFGPVGSVARVADRDAHRADLIAATKMVVEAIAIGAVVGVAFALIPV
jgi:hypothetical protein